jgi:hypothetical protein
MARKRELDKEHTISGMWWLPSRPNKIVPGTLTYRPGTKIELQLAGRLHSKAELFGTKLLGPREPNFELYGKSPEGELFTLRDCYSVHLPGYQEVIAPHFVMAGMHYDVAGDSKIDTAQLEITNLGAWVDQFKCTGTYAPELTDPALAVAAKPSLAGNAFEGRLPHISATLAIPQSVSWSRGPSSMKLTYQCHIRLTFDQPVEMDRASEIAGHVRHLLSLLIGKPTLAGQSHLTRTSRRMAS